MSYYSGKYSDLAPPNSYIDVADFNSTRELAEYLVYLDKNSTAYLSYFKWKETHEIKSYAEVTRDAFCQLCEKLQVNNFSRTKTLCENVFVFQDPSRLPAEVEPSRFLTRDRHCKEGGRRPRENGIAIEWREEYRKRVNA